jgi:hypothetical protein
MPSVTECKRKVMMPHQEAGILDKSKCSLPNAMVYLSPTWVNILSAVWEIENQFFILWRKMGLYVISTASHAHLLWGYNGEICAFWRKKIQKPKHRHKCQYLARSDKYWRNFQGTCKEILEDLETYAGPRTQLIPAWVYEYLERSQVQHNKCNVYKEALWKDIKSYYGFCYLKNCNTGFMCISNPDWIALALMWNYVNLAFKCYNSQKL